MNKHSRKELAEALGAAEAALETLRNIADEEREKFDNMPESLQIGDMAQEIEQAADVIGDVADWIENAIDTARDFT